MEYESSAKVVTRSTRNLRDQLVVVGVACDSTHRRNCANKAQQCRSRHIDIILGTTQRPNPSHLIRQPLESHY